MKIFPPLLGHPQRTYLSDYSMASNACKAAVFISIIGLYSAQTYHAPIKIAESGRPLRYIRPLLPTLRRADSCDQYPGSSCMFVLLCLMGGGVSMGSCSGGLLSTCCAPPVQQNSLQRWTNQVAPSKVIQSTKEKEYVGSNRTAKVMGNVTVCGVAQPKPQSRIVGGYDAMYGEFPWQAHIKLDRQQCGGVLLNNYYVLTAAHCIYQVRLGDITVQLGVYDIQDHSRQEFAPQSFSVVEKKIHPQFKYQQAHPDRYDVALLKLDKAARYHGNVVPICLPQKDWNFLGWKGTITGWGKTDPGLGNRYGTRVLQKVEVPIISNKQCENWHQEKGIDIKISPEMMCAGFEEGKRDACVGDSGGPLMVVVNNRWTLAGLVSAGFGCAQARQPGIYHRASNSVEWVRANIIS